MLTPITIKTTSERLVDICWIVKWQSAAFEGEYSCIIQNLWDTNIYIWFIQDVTIEWWIQIVPWSSMTWNTKNIDKMRVISEWSENNNIRLAIY